MKTTLLRWNALTSVFSVLFLLSALCPLSSVFAQGSLTPPGGPAPTMKSLDQVAPRTPISSLPFTISSSGGYYLTKSLNIASGDAIIIAVSGVTLDLNGFEITSTEGSPAHSGILINSGLHNIRIANGQIRGNVTFNGSTFTGSGFANGIQTTGSTPTNAHVSDVAVSGCLSQGINLSSGLVESCTVNTIGGTGISADNVIYCEAYVCGTECIFAFSNVTGCVAGAASTAFAAIQSDGMVTGCYATGSPSTNQATIVSLIARDCYAITNGGAGDALLANTAENCNGLASGTNTGSGIHCFQSASNCYGMSLASKPGVNVLGSALNCYGSAFGSGNGISAQTAENCYGVAFGTGTGLSALSAQNCYGSAQGPSSGFQGIGLVATTAANCYGICHVAEGLNARVALNCYGQDTTGGDGTTNSAALTANNAQNCFGQTVPVNGASWAVIATIASFCDGQGGIVRIDASHEYFCGSGSNPYP